ncbi:MAG TPA: dihydrolipoamide acetyltransferase family protein [bacterium]|nr:dihydrolipoamide acetyltransferase family protein [bacterium]
MIHEIIMPKLGETMEEGYVNKWLKKEGDRVKKGEVLLEVMSDKTNFEVESQYDGYLRKIIYEPSDKPVAVTTVIGYISDTPDEQIPETNITQETSKTEKQTEEKPVEKTSQTTEKERIKASPAAKRLANELGVEIEKVKGTGEGGRIEKKDVELYAQQQQTTISGKVEKLSPVRKIIAERLSWSKQNIPHYYLSTKILMNNVEKLKNIFQAQGKKFTYTDFIIFYTSRVLPDFPLINASFINDEIHYHATVDIGIAVNTENGLVVPVMKNLQDKTIEEISATRSNLAEKVRSGKITKEDMENCRFVITNLGMFGVTQFQAIINPPGTAIMAVGSIETEPVVENNNVVIGKTMWVTLSLDHRIVDGAYGGAFLQKLKMVMENPGMLNL